MNVNVASVGEVTRPFPGLRPFDYREHAFYFGRTDQIYALYRLLDANRFVAVVGSSGSGKSSLVFAGLHPLLDKDTAQRGGRHWVWSQMSPKDAPINGLIDLVHDLARQFQPELQGDPASLESQRGRIAYLISLSSQGLVNALSEIEGLKDKTLVLVVDQFEELFRYAKSSQAQNTIKDSIHREEAVLFVQLLLAASRDSGCNARIVLTMRSDFIGDCANFRGLPEAVSQTQFLVPGLSREQFEEVIRQPVKLCGSTIRSNLVERLLNDIIGETDQLPVLQHCLLRLWETAGQQHDAGDVQAPAGSTEPPSARHITVEHYNAIGQIAGALSQHADEILRGLPGLEPVVERVFRALSEIDRDGRAIRRQLTFAALLDETGASEQDLRKVVDRFRADDCSFLRPALSEESELKSETSIDVGHEALLRRWTKVSGDPGATEEKKDNRTIGWMRMEETDRRQYQSLVFLAGTGPADPEPLAASQFKENLRWWTNPVRTKAWAARYAESARYARVEKLLDISRRQIKAKWTRGAAAVVCLLLFAFVIFVWVSNDQRKRAQANLDSSLRSSAGLLDFTLVGLNRGDISAQSAQGMVMLLTKTLDDLQQPIGPDPAALLRIFGINPSHSDQSSEIISVRGRLLCTVSDIFSDLGNQQQAYDSAVNANALADQLAAAGPDQSESQKLRFAALFRIGDIHEQEGKKDQALAVYQQARDIESSLVAQDGTIGERVYNLAFINNKIGEAYEVLPAKDAATRLGNVDRAITEFNAALPWANKAAGLPSAKTQWKAAPAVTLTKIGMALASKGEIDQAISKYDQAIAELEDILKDNSVNNDQASSNLASAHLRKADALRAGIKTDASKLSLTIAEYDAATTIFRQLSDKDVGNANRLTPLAGAYKLYGDMLIASGDKQAALVQYDNELNIRRRLANKDKTRDSWQKALANAQKKVDQLTAELAAPGAAASP
jgi:tetratricopeptide (TPR) repeat protein